MPDQNRIVWPSIRPGTVRIPGGGELDLPNNWILVEPGDATLTRRIKAGGPHWLVQETKGRRVFSKGVWALRQRIEVIKLELAAERDSPEYKKKLAASRTRSAKQQVAYVEDFYTSVLAYLNFAPAYQTLAQRVARAVANHATPIGSGTVARTKRISVTARAEAAVIAWLRHQTTAYDSMHIERIKGRRREVRRELAKKSIALLNDYRQPSGNPLLNERCVLSDALQ